MRLVGWFSHIICDTFWDLIFGSGEVARMFSIVIREDITRNLMFFFLALPKLPLLWGEVLVFVTHV